MKRRTLVLTVCALLFATSLLQAQSVNIQSSVDTANIQIGDALTLTLRADYNPQNFQVQFPVVNDTFNHFELIEKSVADTQGGREINTYTQKIKLTNFDSGVWMIPRFAFIVKPLQGQSPYSVYSDSIKVTVNTIAVDTSKPFKPIFDIRSASMPLQQIIMYVIGGLILAILVGFIIYYYIKKHRNKNKEAGPETTIVKLPPHEQAMLSYKELAEKQLWQQGFEKDYYTALTDIMRTYLEEQFDMDCFEKTSSEIMTQVKRNRALANLRKELRTLFETADMVKFAKSTPTPQQHTDNLEIAKTVVVESYKKIKPADGQVTAS